MKKMTGKKVLIAGILTLGAASAFAESQEDKTKAMKPAEAGAGDVEKATAGWPEASKMAAKKMSEKYGAPAEMTATMLVWNASGPFKRTIVYNHEVEHLFPVKHTDVMEQVVDLSVPPEKVDDLAAYDGSVVVDRTQGEISARCDKEEANILALNLAQEVISGKKTTQQARKTYADTVKMLMAGEMPAIATKLSIPAAKGETEFHDKPAMMMDEMKKVRGEDPMKNPSMEEPMDAPAHDGMTDPMPDEKKNK